MEYDLFVHANAVGYSATGKDVDGNDQIVFMLGNQFVDVADGTSGITLDQLSGTFEESDEIQITDCDDEGVLSSVSYEWWTEEGGMGWDGDGWYNTETTFKVDGPIIAAGQGFWLTLANPSAVTMTESSPVK